MRCTGGRNIPEGLYTAATHLQQTVKAGSQRHQIVIILLVPLWSQYVCSAPPCGGFRKPQSVTEGRSTTGSSKSHKTMQWHTHLLKRWRYDQIIIILFKWSSEQDENTAAGAEMTKWIGSWLQKLDFYVGLISSQKTHISGQCKTHRQKQPVSFLCCDKHEKFRPAFSCFRSTNI